MSEFTYEDGRKAEKLENNVDSLTKVTEVYVEPKPQKKLAKRIIERLCVCERVIETIDEVTGEVVEVVVEKVCGDTQKEVVASPKSSMQSVVEEKLGRSNLKKYLFVAFVVVQVVALGYVVFLM